MEITFNVPRLRFGNFLVKFLPSGKILVVPEGRGFHFTLHPGHNSGKIDLHRTNEGVPDGHPSKHEMLAEMAKEDIVDKLQQMGMGAMPSSNQSETAHGLGSPSLRCSALSNRSPISLLQDATGLPCDVVRHPPGRKSCHSDAQRRTRAAGWSGAMISSDKRVQCPAAFNDEKVGKVFVVIGDDLRRCYVCDQLFTRQGSFEHSKTTCYPPASGTN